MTDTQKLEAIKAEIERRKNEAFLSANFNECKQFILNELQKFIASLDEQSEDCDTCTNDKGCVACENGELYEGKPTDHTKSNEEKASEIANKYSGREIDRVAIIEAMEWKDKQFKQNLDNAFKSADHVQYTNGYNDAVEKAWQYIKENYGGDYASETLMSECKKFFVEYMQEDEE